MSGITAGARRKTVELSEKPIGSGFHEVEEKGHQKDLFALRDIEVREVRGERQSRRDRPPMPTPGAMCHSDPRLPFREP
jgi:hypothetical protein